jgi:regulator of protease activity HflC (stomatin/prohibitin superfamily)
MQAALAEMFWGLAGAAFVVVFLAFRWIKILPEYQRGVIFRLGRVLPQPKGPGLVIVLWPVDRLVRVDLRTIVEAIPPQDVITRDNISVKVNAVVYFRVIAPIPAIVNVEKYLFAMSQLAQTTLRSALGMVDLDELLAEREKINLRLQEIVDRQSEPWGLKVSLLEIKDVDLPHEMTRAIARQAVAEREKRAKVIHAEGEFLAAERLAGAAAVMERQPLTLQLRYLQTLVEIGSDKTSVLPFPVPVDTIAQFLRSWETGQAAAPPAKREPAPPLPHHS